MGKEVRVGTKFLCLYDENEIQEKPPEPTVPPLPGVYKVLKEKALIFLDKYKRECNVDLIIKNSTYERFNNALNCMDLES
jgi:hypothetical protein